MFDFVRSHTRLFLGMLVLLIIPSFVFFGVQGYSSFTDSKMASVAQVGGQAIKANELEVAHRQQIERVRQQMPNVDIKLLDTPAMRRETLDAMIRERVLGTAVVKDHVLVSDARLARLFKLDPQLAALRNADGTVNKDFLAARGMSSLQFAEQLRQDYAMRQVLAGVADTSVSGKKLGEAAAQALLDQREVQVQRFDSKDYLSRVQPSDADLQAYYQGHSQDFRAPEEARIEYAVLDLDALKKQLSLNEEDLRKYYAENASRYTAAEERRASHILINAAADAPAADKAKAKAKAEAVLAEARKNPSAFAELARKNSQDEGSAQRGGDLDFFARGAMVKPFEDAAFAMKPGEISALVESEFGYHIIRLAEIRGGQTKPFEAVRAQIVEEVSKQLAQKRYVEAAEQFSNTVYEQSDSLQPVLDKLKLTKLEATVRRTPAPGATGPLASTKLLDAVFSADSVKNKRNTEAIETGSNQLVSARILSHQPEQVQPLEVVRPKVLERVKAQQALALARKDGEARLAALQQSPTDALPQQAVISRVDSGPLLRQLVEAALRADLAKAPAIQLVDLGEQGWAVLKVLRQVPRPTGDAELARIRPTIGQALAAAETDAYFNALKARFKVAIKSDELSDAALKAAAGASAAK